jgi:hypothetical protein
MAKIIDLELDAAPNLEAAIHQTVGFASVCWENLEGTGVFDSDNAHEAALQLQAWIEARYVKKV